MKSRKLYKRLVNPWLVPLTKWYLRKPRKYRYDDLELIVPAGVFHPAFFLSTHILINYLDGQQLQGRKILELGAGSGLISMVAAKRGAFVVATDISNGAIKSIAENAQRNGLQVHTLQSDLFEDIPQQKFDLVLINPPYYPKDPQSEDERAWYCGSNFEYFSRLFQQIKVRLPHLGKVLIILSEDCNLERIHSLAMDSTLCMRKINQVRKRFEWHFIFQILSQDDGSFQD